MYDSIEIVLVNGYEHTSHNSKKNNEFLKSPIEILETMHNILCWYIKKYRTTNNDIN